MSKGSSDRDSGKGARGVANETCRGGNGQASASAHHGKDSAVVGDDARGRPVESIVGYVR